MRVVFFTAGTHGAGHLARGIAIARALERAGFRGSYRMLGPRKQFCAIPCPDWEEIEIETDEAQLKSPELAKETKLARMMLASSADLVIVDMFWAPLRHVLPLLPKSVECWLLLRASPPAWIIGPPDLPFDPFQYARIVSIEPLSSSIITHPIDPVVLVNPEECRPKGALRERLGVAPEQRLVGVVHAGLAGEHRELMKDLNEGNNNNNSGGDHLAVFDLFEKDALFPIAEWLGDCDELHMGAGYNAYWEARWLGYARRTMFTPFIRRNDNQGWRLARCMRYVMRANGADTIARWIVDRSS